MPGEIDHRRRRFLGRAGAMAAAARFGVLAEQRLYQLIRQPGSVDDRQFEIELLDPGAQAFAFTFG